MGVHKGSVARTDVVEIVPRATSWRIGATCVLGGLLVGRCVLEIEQTRWEEVLLVGTVIEGSHGMHNGMRLPAQFGPSLC